MENKYQSKYIKFSILMILVISGAAIYFWGVFRGQFREEERLEGILASSQQEKYIEHLWRWGDFLHLWEKGGLSCSDLPLWKQEYETSFLRCNPLFIQCLYRKKVKEYLQRDIGGIDFASYDSGKIYRFDLAKNTYYFRYFVGKGKKYTQEIELNNNCKEVELPHNVYGYGELNKKNDWLWDNLNYSIFLDRRYVNNFEVNMWREKTKREVKLYQKKDLFRPSTDLTYNEMITYCHDHGKELLNARVLDAVTSYILKNYKQGDRYLDRSPYPWRGRASVQFLYFAKTDRSFEYSLKYCDQIYTKECLGKSNFGIQKVRAEGLGGVINTLGGFPEAVLNKRFSDWNLSPSSFLFPLSSGWHRSGARAKWNGQLGDKQQIIWMEENQKYGDFPENKGDRVPIAFRCMKMGRWKK